MFKNKMAVAVCALMVLPCTLALAETTIIRETTHVSPAPVVHERTTTTTTVTTGVEPGIVVTEPGVVVTEPGVVVTQPGVVVTQPGVIVTEPRVILGSPRVIRVEEFDINHDNLLVMAEVGEVLFKIYDTDGNNVIDSIEYERPAVVTVEPMQTTTKVTYDFDNDGFADKQVYTYQTFMKQSQLARFDRNGNGLSAHEFAGMSFLEADIDNDHAILLKEWQGLYISSIDKKNRAEAALNK